MLYSDETGKFRDFHTYQSKWNRLEVREVKALKQRIEITEMGVTHIREHFYVLRDIEQGNARIYLARSAQATEFLTLYLGLALERYFQLPDVGTKIDKILSSSSQAVPELLGVHWGVRELPPDWKERLDAEAAPGSQTWAEEEAVIPPIYWLTLLSNYSGGRFVRPFYCTIDPTASRGICVQVSNAADI